MGFASYPDYLKSETWAAIRQEVLAKNPFCELCESSATQVHHAKYTLQSLQSHKSALLVSICHRCHQYVEVKPDGSKETWSMAVTKLLCSLTKLGKYERAAEIAKGVGRIYTPSRYRGSPSSVSENLKSVSRKAGKFWRNSGRLGKR